VRWRPFGASTAHRLERNLVVAAGKIEVYWPEAVSVWTNNLFFSEAGTIVGVPLQKGYSPGTPAPLEVPGVLMNEDPQVQFTGGGFVEWPAGSPAAPLGIEPLRLPRADEGRRNRRSPCERRAPFMGRPAGDSSQLARVFSWRFRQRGLRRRLHCSKPCGPAARAIGFRNRCSLVCRQESPKDPSMTFASGLGASIPTLTRVSAARGAEAAGPPLAIGVANCDVIFDGAQDQVGPFGEGPVGPC
jgi:hypothetical protein